jgi:tubulin-specific chaperone B
MDDETYARRQDTVLAFKQRNKMGRFDPANSDAASSTSSKSQQPGMAPLPPDFKLGARCEVDLTSTGKGKKRGTIRFIGETDFGAAAPGAVGAGGKWIGVEYDEPAGKNDGSVSGKRYFSCRPNYGGFVRPDKVNVGDYPEEEISSEDDDDDMEL